ncbi:MAG: hypothetical protein JO115_23880 [Pseudonocardiales bacterium]|nr:hypothetical protein [Pseudonocardiales bacterium]
MSKSTTERTPLLSLHGLNPAVALDLAPGWHPQFFPICLSPYWQSVPWGGANWTIEGTSFLLLPAAQKPGGYSARFDPSSPFFQCFLGLYMIAPVQGERVPLDLYSSLVHFDYLAWGQRLGDPAPRGDVDIRIHRVGVEKWAYDSTAACHFDVGPNNPQHGMPPFLTVPRWPIAPGAAHWSDVVDSYDERIDLVRGHLWYEGPYLVCSYFSGARFTDRAGRTIDTHTRYPHVLQGEEETVASIRVFDRGTGYRGPTPFGSLNSVTERKH